MYRKQFFQFVHSLAIVLIISSETFFQSCSNSAEKNNDSTVSNPQIPDVQVTRALSKVLHREVRLPGEISAYQDVGIYPRVEGFVDTILVDRGSRVKRGEPLIVLAAPELVARQSEAEAKARSATAQLEEAVAKLSASKATYDRLHAASSTPGVVAGNDLEIAQRTKEADEARVGTAKENEKAAREEARSIEQTESYLRVYAPFDGVITERNVHEGSLVGHGRGTADPPLVRIQEVARLRLTINVPEPESAGIKEGITLEFAVPAYPGEKFRGAIRRVAHALDMKTRSMPVELDVENKPGRLAPGMYADVIWIVQRSAPSLFVPPSAIVNTTERSFVICVRDNQTKWVNVEQGFTAANLVEVFGDLDTDEMIVLRGTDELRERVRVNPVETPSGQQ